jgi:hypothetical protein
MFMTVRLEPIPRPRQSGRWVVLRALRCLTRLVGRDYEKRSFGYFCPGVCVAALTLVRADSRPPLRIFQDRRSSPDRGNGRSRSSPEGSPPSRRPEGSRQHQDVHAGADRRPGEPADWFPDSHPPAPALVSKGSGGALRALVHLFSGSGTLKSADISGYTVDYFVQR